MTFLLRVVLPDRPGSLGAVATAIGAAGGDITSLDVVERGPDGAVDDVLVELSPGTPADVLITAAHSVPGVLVESLRPYGGGPDLHRDLQLVDALALEPGRGLAVLAEHAPGVFRAGWALLLSLHGAAPRVLGASAGAPDPDGIPMPWLPLASAARFGREEAWIPERWRVLGMEMAAAPAGPGGTAILVGRPGGPRFRGSEVLRLEHLAGLAAAAERAR